MPDTRHRAAAGSESTFDSKGRKPLVICIGNIARGDDGAAHRVASMLRTGGTDDGQFDLVTAVGLDVAMASDVAQASVVVVVDARRREQPLVEVEPLAATASHRASGHAVDAPTLLALAEKLYGAAPPAWVVSVAAPDMGHGELLSKTAEAASAEAASVVLHLLAEAEG